MTSQPLTDKIAINNMERFFSIFGKIMLVLLILGSMIYGGYYFGKQTKTIAKPEAVQTENNDSIIETENSIVSPSPSPLPQTTIVAGVSKSAGLSFDQYSVVTPQDWTAKKESQSALDEKLILTKGNYSITIFQAATGGALCLYPGDADFEGPSSKFQVFTTLTTKDARTLRRSGDVNATAFTVCQKSADGSYQQPTNYGHISIKTPELPAKAVVEEIDLILASLKKI